MKFSEPLKNTTLLVLYIYFITTAYMQSNITDNALSYPFTVMNGRHWKIERKILRAGARSW
jgi:hypothetical protein